jgi:CheY-like chemotaxis protein
MPNKILIVDDNAQNLFILKMSLRKLDAEIVEAISGAEALAAVADNAFSCILLDLMMPEMSGVEVAQKLKDDEQTKNIPLMFISAVPPEHEDAILASEFGTFFQKPYDPNILNEKVNEILSI